MQYDQYFETVKTLPVETCGEQNRKLIAKSLAALVNEVMPHELVPDPRLSQLEQNGIVPITTFNDQQIVDIVNHLQTRSVYNAHVPYGDGVKRHLSDARNHAFGCYELFDLVTCPHLMKVALNEDLLNLAANYLGCLPTLYSINSWWSFPGRGVAGTQKYHRDYDDYKFLAVFVYLTDVTMTNGVHCYINHTHDTDVLTSVAGIRFEDPLSVCDTSLKPYEQVLLGKAGTSFMSDTYGIHKSMPLTAGDRLVMWIRYGLANNGPAKAQLRYKVPKSVMPDTIQFDDKTNYITRLILE